MNELSQFIVAQLVGDADLSAMVGRPLPVHDKVPFKPEYPFVILGTMDAIDAGAQESRASSVIATLDLWTRESDRDLAGQLADRITAVFDGQRTQLQSAMMTGSYFLTMNAVRVSADDALRTRLRFRFHIEQTTV